MIDPEKKLWQSVLLTAVSDALTKEKSKSNIYQIQVINDARDWLFNNNSHYFRVCSMADINPLALRNKVKEALTYKHYTSSTQDESNLIGCCADDINNSSDS